MDRKFLTPEEAEAMLPEGEYIHTFRGGSGIMIGADWKRESIIEAFKTRKPELSGQFATAMGHGIAFFDDNGALFVKTKEA